MEFNSDFRYDLKLGQVGEHALAKMISDEKLEVKFDWGTHRTGNFYIEYESRGKVSGIAKSEAKYWCLIAASPTADRKRVAEGDFKGSDALFSIIINKDRLKEICECKAHRKDVKGGDANTSLGYLIKAVDLLLSL